MKKIPSLTNMFLFTMQYYLTITYLSVSRRNQKNPRTENYAPPPHPCQKKAITSRNFRALKFFREGLNDMARQQMESNCLLLVIYRTICWINLKAYPTVWTARPALYARYSTIRLFWISFEIPTLIKATKNVYIYIYIFAKFSCCQRNPLMKNIKTKKKYLYHLGNFNSPFPDKPPPCAGHRVKYCLRCSFWLLAVFRHFPPSSVCPGFCHFRNILMCCAILLQYAAFKASIKGYGLLAQVRASYHGVN